ncbi:MAG: hypothetical protein WDO15_19150 [Bacteroidota bacterium]
MNFSLNDKQLSVNSEVVKYPLLIIFSVVFSFLSTTGVQAQVERPVRPPAGQLPVKPDTIPPLDSLQNKADTLATQPDSVKTPPKKDIETTIFYSARDSINSNMQKKIIKLYGNAKIKYGTIELEADEIVIDYESSTITAHGIPDSTGRMVGLPIFKDGGQTYETHDMIYNFKTKRAKITEVVTNKATGSFMATGFIRTTRANSSVSTTLTLPAILLIHTSASSQENQRQFPAINCFRSILHGVHGRTNTTRFRIRYLPTATKKSERYFNADLW